MVYNVIGLMSGSSHDGLDIAFVEITDVRNDWSFEIKHATCIPFEANLEQQLKNAASLSVPEFLKLHTFFGRWMGQQINDFIASNALFHKVHFIASHGHTVYHDPAQQTSTQIGDGASIAAITGLPAITDLRNMDVALMGQGAPIVPIADQLLFKDFAYCLNIGGICNVTINREQPIAFDIAPANQVLDFYAQKLGQRYDTDGSLAAKGTVNAALLEALNGLSYYKTPAPKSLSNSYSSEIISIVASSDVKPFEDILATLNEHIAVQIVNAVNVFSIDASTKMLITGGGAFNKDLVRRITNHVAHLQIEVVVPEPNWVNYKEALAMALVGVLRWREESNVLSSVTGASRNSSGGALWLGNS